MSKRLKKSAESVRRGYKPAPKRKKRKAAKRPKRPSSSPPKKRKRRKAAKRRKRSSSKRAKWHTQPGRGRGFKFEVARHKVDRRGYDAAGKYWGKNSREMGKLYRVRVIDRATDLYSDSFVHAQTKTDAKAKVSAMMVRTVAQQPPRGPMHEPDPRREHLLERERHAISHSRPRRGKSQAFGGHGRHHDGPINLEGATDDELNAITMDGYAHSSYRQLAAMYLRSRAARLRGDIDTAMRLERDAEFVYDRLPAELRW